MTKTPTPGRAAPEATRAWAERFRAAGRAPGAFRPLGKTGLTASLLGFGCYRVHAQVPHHAVALAKAFAEGVNLVDTSSNYGDGGSERMVGDVLAREIARGAVRREEIVVVSKVGYVQGGNMDVVLEAKKARNPFPEVVEYMDECWHCIHPRFLEDQLGRSMRRLGVEHLDVYLLHNPEYFFTDLKHRGALEDEDSLDRARETFYGRVREAFRFLQAKVNEGVLGAYGVSSNTFGGDAEEADFVSLERCLRVAEEVGAELGGDGFAVVQAPLNLYEGGPALEKNQFGGEEPRSFLRLAADSGLGVLINRPLNAFAGGSLVRLADRPAGALANTEAELGRALAHLNALEREFDDEIAPHLGDVLVRDGERQRPFVWAVQLGEAYPSFTNVEHWEQIFSRAVQPQIAGNLQVIDRTMQAQGGEPHARWADWRDRFVAAANPVLRLISQFLEQRAAGVSADVRRRLGEAWPEWTPKEVREASLSRQAIAAVAGLEGVTTVLCGMRSEAYVADACGVMRLPAAERPAQVFRAFAS